ncbi:MAG: molybdopterin-dependent oxidoreductase [Pseudomonadota bacterium]
MRRLWISLGFALSLIATHVRAELPAPQGTVLLTISGHIGETNVDDRAEFDRDMLQSIGVVEFETRTPWTEGDVRFTGISVAALLERVSPSGASVRAVAANDYVANIPIAILRDGGAILAMQMDGEPLTLRNKGPLWIIFPWSDKPELDRIEIHNYAVWQLLSMQIQ